MCTYTYVNLCTYTHTHAHTYIYTHTHIYIYTCIYMYIFLHIYMHIRIKTHIHYQLKVFGHNQTFLFLTLKVLILMKQEPQWFYLLYWIQVFLNNFDFCITRYLFKNLFKGVFLLRYWAWIKSKFPELQWIILLRDIRKRNKNKIKSRAGRP